MDYFRSLAIYEEDPSNTSILYPKVILEKGVQLYQSLHSCSHTPLPGLHHKPIFRQNMDLLVVSTKSLLHALPN